MGEKMTRSDLWSLIATGLMLGAVMLFLLCAWVGWI